MPSSWEALVSWWERSPWPWLLLGPGTAVLLGLAIFHLSKYMAEVLAAKLPESIEADKRADFFNDTWKTSATVLGGGMAVLAFLGAYLTDLGQRDRHREQQSNLILLEAYNRLRSTDALERIMSLSLLSQAVKDRPDFADSIRRPLTRWIVHQPRNLNDAGKFLSIRPDVQLAVELLARLPTSAQVPLSFNEAYLVAAEFPPGSSFRGATFYESILLGASFRNVDLRDARFGGVTMTDFEAYSRSPQPYGPWSETLIYGRGWREGWQSAGYTTDFGKANLSRADFSGAGLSGASFRGSRLHEANFTRANLSRTDFTDAEGLDKAIFTSACIGRVDETLYDDDKPRFAPGTQVVIVVKDEEVGWKAGRFAIKICSPPQASVAQEE